MGILYVYTFNILLPIITLFVLFITPRFPIILFFVMGLLLAFVHQWFILPKGLPNIPVIPRALIQGTIASIPLQNPNKTQFLLDIETLDGHPAQGLVQLAWYNKAPTIHAGQRWQFSVKIKKPRNFLNPGSSDYVNALATRHISWTGYIQNKNNIRLADIQSNPNWLVWRENLSRRLTHISPNTRTAGILEALTLNITTQITQEDWSLFRRTGTTHLFGISGEHIALVSGLVFMILKWLWSRSYRLCLRIPAIYVASISALFIALLYAFLAGFAPPVQRALIGCFFYTVYCLGKQRFTPWQVWRYALFSVLCLEPHAVFMQGFYFSFLAAACLLLTQQRWRLQGYKSKLALQLSCFIGLMPLSLYWFSYGSINGFIANLFAIPLVGLLIVPLALMTVLICSYSWSWLLMKPLSWLISLLFQGLALTEQIASINITTSLTSIEQVIALMGALLIWSVLPIQPFRGIAFLWFILSFFPQRTAIDSGAAVINVLDVGQGLSVVIQTKNHVLLYDTGDQFFKGSDLGKMVILPYLNKINIKKIDTIVISHPDKDHRGGLNSIEESLPVGQLLVNNIRYYHRGLNCHDYPPWSWDGVSFRFLPIKKSFKGKNNSSCILQVSNDFGRVLLTGDIEKMAEEYLLQKYKTQVTSDVLIIPHHGSKTSSSYRFLLEVAPHYAIASLGFDNRFHFPHAKTLASMKSLGINFYRTDECGMVHIDLLSHSSIPTPTCFNKSG